MDPLITTISFPRERVQVYEPSEQLELVRALFQRDAPALGQPPFARDEWELEQGRAPSRRGAQVSSLHDDDEPCARDKARGYVRAGANCNETIDVVSSVSIISISHFKL